MFWPARRFWHAVSLVMALAVGAVGWASPATAQIPYLNLISSEPKYAAIVVDANSGEVLYAKSPDAPRYPASITKIMTLYLAFEAVNNGQLSLDDFIVVSPHAAAQAPSKLGLRAGETISVADAMHAVAVKSANDMAVALAEKIGGSESRFAALMTLRANELGMSNSRFVNASGLPDARQITTARDIAILSRAVMRDYPQFYVFFSQRQFAYRGEVMKNHNGLLGKMPGVDGLKTGFTNASGFNLAASAVREHQRLIAVVMWGNSVAARDNHEQDLLEKGFYVLAQRQQGQTTTIAQNLFEPAPVGPVARPPSEQGDGEQAGLKIVVSDKPLRGAEEIVRVKEVCKTTGRGRHKHKTCSRVRVREKIKTAAECRPVRGKHHHRHACVSGDDQPAQVAHNERAERGRYLVQVGAFKDKAQARAAVGRLTHRYSDHLGDAKAQVSSKVDGYYRARFAGLSSSAAHDACSALKAHGQTCTVVAPG